MDKDVYQELKLREKLRLKLLEANALVTDFEIDDINAEMLSPEEILAIGQLPENTPTSTQLIDEDRGLY